MRDEDGGALDMATTDDVAAAPGALEQNTEGASNQKSDGGEKGAEDDPEISLEEKFKKWIPEVLRLLHEIKKAMMMIMMMMNDDHDVDDDDDE